MLTEFNQQKVCASGEAIVGTLRYIFILAFYVKLFRASGEAILGTVKYVLMHFTFKTFRASGEAILDTLNYSAFGTVPS